MNQDELSLQYKKRIYQNLKDLTLEVQDAEKTLKKTKDKLKRAEYDVACFEKLNKPEEPT